MSTEPPDDWSCLTTPGAGGPRDGLLPVPLTRSIQTRPPSPCGGLPTPALRCGGGGGGGGGAGAKCAGFGCPPPQMCPSVPPPPPPPRSPAPCITLQALSTFEQRAGWARQGLTAQCATVTEWAIGSPEVHRPQVWLELHAQCSDTYACNGPVQQERQEPGVTPLNIALFGSSLSHVEVRTSENLRRTGWHRAYGTYS